MLTHELRSWLLEDGDPSVKVRVLRELYDRPNDDGEVADSLEQIGVTGWAAKILSEQLPSGQWGNPGSSDGELYRPKYIATHWRLLVLADLGVTRAHPGIARAVERYFAGDDYRTTRFADSSAELCFTGNTIRMFRQFGYGDDPRLAPGTAWLIDSQKADGGWHCFPSETGTLDGWEGLSAFATIPTQERSAGMRRSVERGAEFYLERQLLEEDPATYEPWYRLHYPVHYYYDVLVGLDVLTRLGFGSDPRLRKALDLLESKRRADGRWALDAYHPDLAADLRPEAPFYPFALEGIGQPSRWITTTALSVLRRAGRL